MQEADVEICINSTAWGMSAPRRRAACVTLQLTEPGFDEVESDAEVVAGLLSGALLSAGLASAAVPAFAESAPDFDSGADSDDGELFEA